MFNLILILIIAILLSYLIYSRIDHFRLQFDPVYRSDRVLNQKFEHQYQEARHMANLCQDVLKYVQTGQTHNQKERLDALNAIKNGIHCMHNYLEDFQILNHQGYNLIQNDQNSHHLLINEWAQKTDRMTNRTNQLMKALQIELQKGQ